MNLNTALLAALAFLAGSLLARRPAHSAPAPPSSLERELRAQRKVVNDIHKRLTAVSKGLPKAGR